MTRDLYDVLGVERSATPDDLKRAFRALARQHHPDSNPDDPNAAARFQEINLAYETLRDPERRRRYDHFGETAGSRGAGAGGGPAPGDVFGFGDLFDSLFNGDAFGGRRRSSGPARGEDAEILVELTLEEAATGTTRSIEVQLPVGCSRCDGSGCEPGTFPSRCDVCGGAGEIRQVRRSVLGQLVTASECVVCAGTGQRILSQCKECRGEGRLGAVRAIDVDIPVGVDTGQRLRLSGRGPAAPRGGVSGDLYVQVRLAPHDRFERHGDDLVFTCRLGITQAVLGAELSLDTLDGTEELVIPVGTQPGQVFRLRGLGMPTLRSRGRGDLLVKIAVEVPKAQDDDEARLWRDLAEHRGEDVAPPAGPGVFSRLRSAFQER